MGRADYLKVGDHNALCDRCKRKYKASQLRSDGQYPNLMVCDTCYDPRHPQEFLRGRPDNSNVPWSRPDTNANTSVTTYDGVTLTNENYYDVNGDVSKTLTVGTDNPVQHWNTALTSYRSATLSKSGANQGNMWFIYRTATDNFGLIVNGVNTMYVPSLLKMKYDGKAWVVDDYSTIGL